jgi:hypothetical protein
MAGPPLYTTCWGLLKQPDNQKAAKIILSCPRLAGGHRRIPKFMDDIAEYEGATSVTGSGLELLWYSVDRIHNYNRGMVRHFPTGGVQHAERTTVPLPCTWEMSDLA